MKKILCLMLLLLVLVACKEAPKSEDSETAPIETEPAAKETVPVVDETPPESTPVSAEPQIGESKSETAPQPETKVSDVDPKLRDLLKRADEKVTSLSYLYGGTETGNLFLDTYQLKGENMKIKKYEENYYVRDGYYDTIYVNLGVGCCEERSRCISHNVDNMNRSFSIDVSTLNIPKTPYQWLKEVKNAVIIGPETFDERSVTTVRYTDANGQLTHMWIDDTYGVPHKIVVVDKNGNEVKYQFNDMKFNQFKDADFDAPCD